MRMTPLTTREDDYLIEDEGDSLLSIPSLALNWCAILREMQLQTSRAIGNYKWTRGSWRKKRSSRRLLDLGVGERRKALGFWGLWIDDELVQHGRVKYDKDNDQ